MSTMSDADKSWINIEISTTSALKEFIQNNELLMICAGAIFALHQDTLRAYAIDMRSTDDVAMGVAMDRIQPNVLGDFPTRVGLVMKALNGIDNMNLDTIEKPLAQFIDVDEKDYRLLLLMCKMRSVAARVWLLTMYSKVKHSRSSGMKLGVLNMWAILQVVPPAEMHEYAKMFTGSFFNDVRSEPMNLAHWLQNPK